MKFRERFAKSVIEDTKERFFESRLTPVFLTVVATVLVMRVTARQPKIVIHVHANDYK